MVIITNLGNLVPTCRFVMDYNRVETMGIARKIAPTLLNEYESTHAPSTKSSDVTIVR